MKKILIYIFCSILFLIACKRSHTLSDKNTTLKELTIDLRNTQLETDQPVFPEYKFLKLETTDQSLLSGVYKVIVFEENIFILSALGGEIMAFDTTGKFRFKLEKGRGPGEILYPTDIALSETRRQLLVLDRYRTLKTFNLNGKYVDSEHLNNVALYIATSGEKNIYFDSNFDKKNKFYGLIKEKNKNIYKFFPKKGDKLCEKSNLIYPYPFNKFDEDTVLVYSIFSDTIYSVCSTQNEAFPFYILNYMGKSMNQSELFKSVTGFGDYQDFCKNNGYGSGVENLVKSGKTLFFGIEGKKYYFVRYNLETGSVMLHTQLMSGLPNIYAKVGETKEHVIYSMTASWLYEHLGKNPALDSDCESLKRLREIGINEEENPILFFCSIEV